jgi:hypothetical protein
MLLGACNPYSQDDYKKHYVVESYLIADAILPMVKVSKTLPIGEQYSFDRAALNNATVKIQQLSSGGRAGETYSYHHQANGIYWPDSLWPVLPLHRYKLIVSFPNGDSVTAQTRVPGAFHQAGNVPDSVVYEASQPITVDITPSKYPGRQAYFVLTAKAIDPSEDKLTPYYANLVKNKNNKITNYYVNNSRINNAKDYERNADSTLTIKIPWQLITFYGENRIIITSLDDNLYDFLRSQSLQTGGSALPPGQLQNIIYHVHGGIGIFGSAAVDFFSVFVKKVP